MTGARDVTYVPTLHRFKSSCWHEDQACRTVLGRYALSHRRPGLFYSPPNETGGPPNEAVGEQSWLLSRLFDFRFQASTGKRSKTGASSIRPTQLNISYLAQV